MCNLWMQFSFVLWNLLNWLTPQLIGSPHLRGRSNYYRHQRRRSSQTRMRSLTRIWPPSPNKRKAYMRTRYRLRRVRGPFYTCLRLPGAYWTRIRDPLTLRITFCTTSYLLPWLIPARYFSKNIPEAEQLNAQWRNMLFYIKKVRAYLAHQDLSSWTGPWTTLDRSDGTKFRLVVKSGTFWV